jgi:transposase
MAKTPATKNMPEAYPDELRCRLLGAHTRKEGNLRELAVRFVVSYGWAKKIHRQQLQTGQMERVEQSRYGPVSAVTPEVEEQLRQQIRKQPDVTLAELQERMFSSSKVQLSVSRWGAILQGLGLHRKKNSIRARTRR